MNYWLVKSEPSAWSWQDHWNKKGRVEPWNGVRNHQAASNLKAMRKGDRAFFYHSIKGKEIVGILEVVKEAYPDPSDDTGRARGGFVMVDFKAIEPLSQPVTLEQIKADKQLAEMALVKQSRLSVMPVTPAQWQRILKLARTST